MPHLHLQPVEVDDDTMSIIASKPAGMPLEEFAGFLIQFGAAQYRDAQQQEQLELLVRKMNQRIAECYQQETGAIPQDNVAPSSVAEFAPRMKGV